MLKKTIGNLFSRLTDKKNTFISTRSSDKFTLQKNDYGVVSTETAAIQKIVSRAVADIEGITDAAAVVEAPYQNSPLKIRFSLKLEENFSVNDVSKNLVAAVRGELEKIFAIVEVEIYVRVTDVSRVEKKPKRRVR